MLVNLYYGDHLLQIEAEAIGYFAVHRRIKNESVDSTRFAITHIPSGSSMVPSSNVIKTLKHAKNYARGLHSLVYDFTQRSPFKGHEYKQIMDDVNRIFAESKKKTFSNVEIPQSPPPVTTGFKSRTDFYVERKERYSKEFLSLFGFPLEKLMHPTFGFDIVAFDEKLQVPDGISIRDFIVQKHGQRASDIVTDLNSACPKVEIAMEIKKFELTETATG